MFNILIASDPAQFRREQKRSSFIKINLTEKERAQKVRERKAQEI
jgi:hypothetical protein